MHWAAYDNSRMTMGSDAGPKLPAVWAGAEQQGGDESPTTVLLGNELIRPG